MNSDLVKQLFPVLLWVFYGSVCTADGSPNRFTSRESYNATKAAFIFGNLYSPSKMVAKYNIKQIKTVEILK